ncbi:hypothetical protein CAPTEDRAFT_193996 [Capitella teleta]|uniref:Uncharacterized protein n=1 Tax=Capitella teleta TaxID=283909 RepID=R7T3K4_CAPTE|nr:hypothetical protein CAPTEDRAFT_193996 [Capitella teleta]|eukprot:ELT87278.1 hypothetical protein CAPTEDRAFT_193996 [Capitella teleta]
MDLNGVIDFIESQDDDAFTLTSCETSFEDDLCLGRGRFREILETMKTQHSNISSPLDQDFAKCLEHLDHFENLIEELETISRASACPWAQVHCFLTSQKIQDMCRELNINSAAVLQVALQFCWVAAPPLLGSVPAEMLLKRVLAHLSWENEGASMLEKVPCDLDK